MTLRGGTNGNHESEGRSGVFYNFLNKSPEGGKKGNLEKEKKSEVRASQAGKRQDVRGRGEEMNQTEKKKSRDSGNEGLPRGSSASSQTRKKKTAAKTSSLKQGRKIKSPQSTSDAPGIKRKRGRREDHQ